MAWIVLILAGIFEIVWAYSMKLSEGFTQTYPEYYYYCFHGTEFCFAGLCDAYFAARYSLYDLDRDWCSGFISHWYLGFG